MNKAPLIRLFAARRFMHTRWQMMVDDIGDVTITNDGATILKLLEVTDSSLMPSEKNFVLSCTLENPWSKLQEHSTA